MWSGDAKALYYVSDKSGSENIWTATASGGAAKAVTSFTDGRVIWPTIAYDGKTIVFERDFGVWSLDVATGKAARVPIALRGAATSPVVEHQTLTQGFQSLALSPDGKKVAFVAHGDVFAASARDGGEAARITTTPELELQLAWAPDSRRLAYVSSRDGPAHVFVYDFAARTETKLTNGPLDDVSPTWSPDGKSIAFDRGGKELRVIDVATKQDRTIATGQLDRPPFLADRPIAWSPDGQWIAYLSVGEGQFQNPNVASVNGGGGKPVAFLSNTFGNTIAWSPDGTYLLFDSSQRTEQVGIGARRPGAEDAAVPRRPVPRPLRSVAARHAGPTGSAARGASARQRDAARRFGPGRGKKVDADRVRGHSPPDQFLAGRRRRAERRRQPRRQDGAAERRGRRAGEPVHLLARRAGERSRGGASAHFHARLQAGGAVQSGRKRGLLPGERPAQRDQRRLTRRAVHRRVGRSGRRLFAREARRVSRSVEHSRRQFLRAAHERRGLARRRAALRAVRRRRPEHRGSPPHHAPHGRRAECVALRRERSQLVASAQRRPARRALRSKRVRAAGQAACDRSAEPQPRGARRREAGRLHPVGRRRARRRAR